MQDVKDAEQSGGKELNKGFMSKFFYIFSYFLLIIFCLKK